MEATCGGDSYCTLFKEGPDPGNSGAAPAVEHVVSMKQTALLRSISAGVWLVSLLADADEAA